MVTTFSACKWQVASSGQIRNQFKWCQVVVKFRADSSGTFGGQMAVEFATNSSSIFGGKIVPAFKTDPVICTFK